MKHKSTDCKNPTLGARARADLAAGHTHVVTKKLKSRERGERHIASQQNVWKRDEEVRAHEETSRRPKEQKSAVDRKNSHRRRRKLRISSSECTRALARPCGNDRSQGTQEMWKEERQKRNLTTHRLTQSFCHKSGDMRGKTKNINLRATSKLTPWRLEQRIEGSSRRSTAVIAMTGRFKLLAPLFL